MMRPGHQVADLRGGIPLMNRQLQKKPQDKMQWTPRSLLDVSQYPGFAVVVLGGVLVAVVALLTYRLITAMGVDKLLEVLIVPLVIAISAFWLNRSLKMHELNIAEERTQDDAVQAYLDHMATLLTDQQLRHGEPHDEPSICARAGTLLTLRRVDWRRKRTLLLFLCESGLIRKKLSSIIRKHESPVVNLTNADLRKVDLRECTLPDVVLCHADLSMAKLGEASLVNADLRGTHLNGADVRGADLLGADLLGADLRGTDLTDALNTTQEQIEQTVGDQDTALPDYLKRPESWSLDFKKQEKDIKEQYGEQYGAPQHEGVFRSGN